MYLEQLVMWAAVLCVGAHGPHHPRSGHRHHRVDRSVKMTEDRELLQDKEHIREDLKNVVADNIADTLTPEELEFYYFSIHDSDNNTKLDGLEILNAVQHTTHAEPDGSPSAEKIGDINQIIDVIDRVLEEDDSDRDGYLSYVEYVQGRNREEGNRHKGRNAQLK